MSNGSDVKNAEKSQEPLLYTVKGVCQTLGLSRSRFYQKAKAGHFTILKDDGRSVIDGQEVRKYYERIVNSATKNQ